MEESILTPEEFMDISSRLHDFQDKDDVDVEELLQIAQDACRLHNFCAVLLSDILPGLNSESAEHETTEGYS